ncbi:MAG: amino acid adenylation domain-containing protein [Lachnospiraceae bacterium]|nr:amino acid adenylation domain-containing protein [Lachnospiraceae bacterium]
MKNVLDLLEDAAGKYTLKTAYSDQEKSISFEEVLLRARAVGTYLLKNNTGEGPVAVMLNRSVDTIVAFLGVVYSGHAYAPVGLDIPDERREKILKRLKPSFIINEELLPAIFEERIDRTLLDDKRRDILMTDPLYVIFTSGSGGDPKGVITSHLSLLNYIEGYAGVMGIDSDDVMAAQSPLDYIAAIRDIYVPLLTGAEDVLVPKEYFMQPDVLFDLLNEKRVSCIGWSTSAISILTKLKAFKDKKPEFLRKICFSGSVMNGAVLRKWQEELPDALFVNQYGPTETTASCTYYKLDHPVEEDEIIPIGLPYPDYRVFLLSEDDGPVKRGEEGEIAVAGAGVTLGYINDPERTAAAFTFNPLQSAFQERIYRTGDIGVFREDGLLIFHGRKDRQIKHMGHRVELDEIESAAAASGIERSAALYDGEKENLWLFYEGDTDVKTLSLSLREKLPGFMVPRKIRCVENLPLLPNGKTDFNALKSMIH